jgi:L,D-peptidoglycan transpeptidase YkuD (ErfK/YbiS/YcfS/YnhG family)
MRKVLREGFIYILIALFSVFIIYLLIRITPLPPVSKMEYARESLSKARENNADKYPKKLFTQAGIYYDSAMVNWQKENDGFIFLRDYSKVAMFADLSAKKAIQASENSISSSSGLQAKLKPKIDTLNNLIIRINELFTTYPLPAEIRNRISKGKMLFEEVQIAYENGEYLKANRKLTDSEYLLATSYKNASADLENYFKSFPVWEKWIRRSINESRKNKDNLIIIDKFSRKCLVYQNGAKKFEYQAELGTNWVGDKRERGDKATPEGMYKISKKLDRNKTKYYKALLLDYPNDEDKAKFKSEIQMGTLPASAKIGSLIEIHGNGGKGIDWTDGCVAVTDKEMDALFRVVKVGTPVTIVGSMADLQRVLNK